MDIDIKVILGIIDKLFGLYKSLVKSGILDPEAFIS